MTDATADRKRRQELAWLLQHLPKSEFFERWLQKTGELPPDFEALPSVPFPQDPLEGVRSAEEWPARRAQISALIEQWLLGHAPAAPGNVRGIIEARGEKDGHEVWRVRLEFGPDHTAHLPCLFYPPKAPPPWPVFLSDNDYYINYGRSAADEAGFALCVYGATDPAYIDDKPDPSGAYHDLFGPCDWSAFRRRGWSASRAIDWLLTLPQIDASRVYIGGHSRSAKQAMAAAIFDDRIAGVICSSPGSGGSFAYRHCDQSVFGESADLLTQVFPDWVSLRVRFFAGREHKLPTDSHLIYALLAPRPVIMCTALEDWVEHSWAVEQTCRLTLPVYQMLGKPENLGFRYRHGQHPAGPDTYAAFGEFLMIAAGCRGSETVAGRFPFTPIHRWDYGQWAGSRKVPAAPAGESGQDRQSTRNRINWLLGDGPAYEQMPAEFGVGESEEEAKLLVRNWPDPPQRTKCRFGGGISGNLYYPSADLAGKASKLPAIVWLAPFHTSSGYTASYRYGEVFHPRLAKAGFAVMAFDPIGTALRQEERREFFDRHPDWSLVGKMVLDARHAIDALAGNPDVDPKRIYLVGYAIGGMVALLTSALDDRVAGAVSIAGFTPFRTDVASSHTGGLRRYSHANGWLPRLGAFIGREAQVPVDFNEILACSAPRPMLVVAPAHDRHATTADVVEAVESARQAYASAGAPEALSLLVPDDWNRLTNDRQDEAIAWLAKQDHPQHQFRPGQGVV